MPACPPPPIVGSFRWLIGGDFDGSIDVRVHVHVHVDVHVYNSTNHDPAETIRW